MKEYELEVVGQGLFFSPPTGGYLHEKNIKNQYSTFSAGMDSPDNPKMFLDVSRNGPAPRSSLELSFFVRPEKNRSMLKIKKLQTNLMESLIFQEMTGSLWT